MKLFKGPLSEFLISILLHLPLKSRPVQITLLFGINYLQYQAHPIHLKTDWQHPVYLLISSSSLSGSFQGCLLIDMLCLVAILLNAFNSSLNFSIDHCPMYGSHKVFILSLSLQVQCSIINNLRDFYDVQTMEPFAPKNIHMGGLMGPSAYVIEDGLKAHQWGERPFCL